MHGMWIIASSDSGEDDEVSEQRGIYTDGALPRSTEACPFHAAGVTAAGGAGTVRVKKPDKGV